MILAIETATAVCGTALVSGGKILAESWLDEPNIHSEKLLTLIHTMVKNYSRTSPAEVFFHHNLKAVAVSIGPGSFTGLRIGLSVAKGLCYSLDLPIIAVPTIEALAWNCISENSFAENMYIMPMINARRNEVYTAFYRTNNNAVEEVEPVQALSYEQCSGFLQSYSQAVIIGDAVERFREYLGATTSSFTPASITQDENGRCRASSVGLIGEQLFNRGAVSSLASLEPFYLKEFSTSLQSQPVRAN